MGSPPARVIRQAIQRKSRTGGALMSVPGFVIVAFAHSGAAPRFASAYFFFAASNVSAAELMQ